MIQVLLVVLVGLLSIVYLYYRYNYNYWIRKGITQAIPVFLVGNYLDAVLHKKNIGWIFNELYSQFPNNDAVGFYQFQYPKLLVRNLDLVETILIKDFTSFYDNEIYASMKLDPFMKRNSFLMSGDDWKPARNGLINGLTKSKLKNMYEHMKSTVPRLTDYIEDNRHEEINVTELARLFMMTNVSNVIYGIDANCFKDKNTPFRQMVSIFTEDYWVKWWQVIILFYIQSLRDFLGYTFVPKKAGIFVEEMMRKVIDTRLKSKIERHDFLEYYLKQNKPSVEEMITEIICYGMTFFVAGFDTSALPSSHLIYELALNPTIQENLYEELQAAYNGKDFLDYDTLVTLPYLDKSFKEILRKYPILYGHMKLCTKTTYLPIDGKDVKIEEGTGVVIPAWGIHHDPQYYPDPEVFDPERFSEEAVKSRHPCSWLPFGAGPRICAGMKFGLLQAKLFIASIVINYEIKCTPKTPLKLTMHKSAFLLQSNEVQWIQLIKRS